MVSRCLVGIDGRETRRTPRYPPLTSRMKLERL